MFSLGVISLLAVTKVDILCRQYHFLRFGIVEMDIFSDIFSTLNLKGALYFRTDFSAPWGVTVPEYQSVARFHIVVQGRCYVTVGGQTAELTAGDMIMIPRGSSHILADSRETKPFPLEQILAETGYAGEGVLTIGEGDAKASTQMVCGHLSFRAKASHPILQSLPEYLMLSNSCRAKHALLDDILRLIVQRIFSDELGSEASITRLSEIVFIELLKSGLNQDERLQSIVNAFQDPKISQALRLMHTQPEHTWTLASLAAEVAMSRSRFAHRFNELVGVAPMGYLSDWRLQKALSLLEGSSLPIQQVSLQAGYQSASAFTRAFTTKFGLSPSDYRQSAA
jgi:AraC-like DNA-binding protein